MTLLRRRSPLRSWSWHWRDRTLKKQQ
jgi:hypothetical protein